MQTLPYIAPASTSSIIDDTVLLDRTKLKAMLSEAYDLKPEQVDALITKAYPKGVGEVTQGTLCTTTPELQCLPLPKGKIIKFSGPAKTS
jgi:ribosomal protein L23